jgi:hypothetical protein
MYQEGGGAQWRALQGRSLRLLTLLLWGVREMLKAVKLAIGPIVNVEPAELPCRCR